MRILDLLGPKHLSYRPMCHNCKVTFLINLTKVTKTIHPDAKTYEMVIFTAVIIAAFCSLTMPGCLYLSHSQIRLVRLAAKTKRNPVSVLNLIRQNKRGDIYCFRKK